MRKGFCTYFQYLEGAIGGLHVFMSDDATASFQYLEGAIGGRDRAGADAGWRSFNTSKVRLEVDGGEPLFVRSGRPFNTSKVRLEGD